MSTNNYTSLMSVKSLSIDEASLIEGRETFTELLQLNLKTEAAHRSRCFLIQQPS